MPGSSARACRVVREGAKWPFHLLQRPDCATRGYRQPLSLFGCAAMASARRALWIQLHKIHIRHLGVAPAPGNHVGPTGGIRNRDLLRLC